MKKQLKKTLAILLAFGIVGSSQGSVVMASSLNTSEASSSREEKQEVTTESQQETITEDKNTHKIEETKSPETSESVVEKSPFAFPTGNLKGDFTLSSQKEKVEAGSNVNFDIYLNITGNQTFFKNANLRLELPKEVLFNQDLQELMIGGQMPVYDQGTGILLYHFDTLPSGVSDKVVLKLQSLNGKTYDGTEIKLKGTFSADNLLDDAGKVAEVEQTASATIVATGKLGLTNKFKGIVDNPEAISPSQGDSTIWEFGFSVPKLDVGTKFLKEGSKIKVTYTLDPWAEFEQVLDQTPAPTAINGQELYWEFDAPSTQVQTEALKELFGQVFRIKVKYKKETPQYTKVKNTLTGNVVFNDGKTGEIRTEQLDATVTVLQSEADITNQKGSVWPIANYGPSDNKGGILWKNGSDGLKVYDSALLGFSLTAGLTYADSYIREPDEYQIDYHIDDHLNISQFFSGYFYYRPNSGFVSANPGWIPLKEDPSYDLYVKYSGEDADWALLKSDIRPEQWYTAQQLGVQDGKHVSDVRFVFTKKPAGMYGNQINFYMTIEKGYVGKVTNYIPNAIVEGWNSQYYKTARWGSEQYPWDDVMRKYFGERYAYVVPVPEGQTKVARATVDFQNKNGNLIEVGDNSVLVTLRNDSASIRNLTGPFKGYALLPTGVKYKTEQPTDSAYETKVVSENYKESGCQLVEVTWTKDSIAGDWTQLRPGKGLYAYINVEVTDQITSSIPLHFYGFVEDTDFTVPTISGTPIASDSYKEADVDDLNGDGSTSDFMVSTGNDYISGKSMILEVEKTVKGDQDEAYSKMAQATVDSLVSYQLSIQNQSQEKVSDFVLIDVLPTVGDKGITDPSDRGSKFDMALSGPIKLPKEWANKMEVTYTTSKNPKRVGILDAHTMYPTGAVVLTDPSDAEDAIWSSEQEVSDWSNIHAFKIQLKEGFSWAKAQGLNVEFELRAPKLESLDPQLLNTQVAREERAAYNSFAIAANQSLAVEPGRVGVTLNKEIQPVLVNYIDTDGNVLADQESLSGKLQEAWTANAKEFEGYTLVQTRQLSDLENSEKVILPTVTGVFTEEKQSVTFVYEKQKTNGGPSDETNQTPTNPPKGKGKGVPSLKRGNPKTGDESNWATMVFVMGISMISGVFVWSKSLRRKNRSKK